MGYAYDVFLSYRRRPPVLDWVENHFHPELHAWLGTSLGRDPDIFLDKLDIVPGARWPQKLEQAIRTSKILVCVWSPNYFGSIWCLAEWKSMRAREAMLKLGTVDRPEGLTYPVVFHDGRNFPPEADVTQARDLRNWNYSAMAFKQTVAYVEFQRQMQDMCDQLAEVIKTVPTWSADWPVEMPPALAPPPSKLLRL